MQSSTSLVRKLLDSPGIIVAPICYDALSARLAEKIGFKAVGLGGFAVGAQTCTTEPLITLTEMVSAAKTIAQAIKIPLVVDADAGYGDPIHVVKTVREFERAGIAGISIEDQVYPKRAHYHRDYKEHTISQEEMIYKIRAAVRARQNKDFLIIGRSDSLKTSGIDEAEERARAYSEAGADLLMLFPNNLEEAKLIPKRLDGIHLVYVNSPGNRVGRPALTVQQAEEFGYKMLRDATSTVIAAYDAVKRTLTQYKTTGSPGTEAEFTISVRKEVEDLIGLPELYALEEETTEKKG